jgi:hypothetical protein
MKCVACVALCAATLAACGSPSRIPVEAARRDDAPGWQNVFERVPDILLMFRPRALQRDDVYGPLLKSALRVAQARGWMRGSSMLQAVEGCDEILVGLTRGALGVDAVVVFRGVPANLDVATMADAEGRTLFRRRDVPASVPEYEWLGEADVGSVFVFGDRVWVGALGAARERAREAFERPTHGRWRGFDRDALAVVRVDPRVVTQTPRAATSRLFGPLLHGLAAFTMTLRPGKAGLEATFTYTTSSASAAAEEQARAVVRDGGLALEWLQSASIVRDDATLVVRLTLPQRLLDELPKATGADLAH